MNKKSKVALFAIVSVAIICILGFGLFFGLNTNKSMVYELTGLEREIGKIAMGKKSANSTEEDVLWKCFAISTDGTTWTKCTGSIPENAKYGYFVLDTYVASLNVEFLSDSKYERNSNDGKTYHTETGLTSVYANDYYYSDMRNTLKNLKTSLNIPSDSKIYKAIEDRTITDLYSEIKNDGTQLALPANAKGSDADKFWLMSKNEVQTYFADNDARKLTNGNLGVAYWLRSPDSAGSDIVTVVDSTDGECKWNLPCDAISARAAFKLKLA